MVGNDGRIFWDLLDLLIFLFFFVAG